MMARHARDGRIEAILARPERRADMVTVDAADLTEAGLEEDHARPGKRALTLILAEHLPVIAALVGRQEIDATLLRRNLVVSGLNLSALKERTLLIGTAEVRVTGPCAPCSRMEEALGPGGYSAMRGHGGMTAEVVSPGRIRVGDAVLPL
ncbi:MOSC domain-containing protein [Silicimonas algicola]|uniref:MOSC domain-containing protein n=2 Tax=Silicimonas algicola TaxID=1826607 RepID=A0A316GCM7_9RHOB|nr:MOSC domain-containing protein [Silicimonas algicola]AZQ69692.1 MOSC domain-containing protein [Silicimonas algicola]PWK57746.1 MOSC domain-containing protein [Silicimonas algicola]